MADLKLDTKINLAHAVALWLAIFGGGAAWATLSNETKNNSKSIVEMKNNYNGDFTRRREMDDRLIRIEEKVIGIANQLDKRERLGQ